MNLTTIKSLLKCEFKLGSRSFALWATLGIPILLAVFFNFIPSFSVLDYSNLAIAVYCEDESELPAFLAEEAKNQEVKFNVIRAETKEKAIDFVKKDKAVIALFFPKFYDQKSRAQEEPEGEVYYNERKPMLIYVLLQELNPLLRKFADLKEASTWKAINVFGKHDEGNSNPNRNLLNMWLIIALISLGIQTIPLSFNEERKTSVIDAILVTRTSGRDFVLSKIIYGLFIMLSTALILYAIVDLSSLSWLVIITIVIGSVGLLSIGFILVMLISPQYGSALLSVVYIPFLIISLLSVKIPFIKFIAYVFPPYYLFDILIKNNEIGIDTTQILLKLLILLVVSTASLIVCTKLANKLEYIQ